MRFLEARNGDAKTFGLLAADEVFSYRPIDDYVDNGIPDALIFSQNTQDNLATLSLLIYQNSYNDGISSHIREDGGEIIYDIAHKKVIKNTLTKSLQKLAQDVREKSYKHIRRYYGYGTYVNNIGVVGGSVAICFASQVLKDTKPYAYKTAVMSNVFGIEEDEMTIMVVSNVLSLFLDYPDNMEKVLKISPRTLKDGWRYTPVENILSNEGKKVPPAILSWANKQSEPSNLLSVLQTICDKEDANNAVIFQDFIKQMKKMKLVKNSHWEGQIGVFYTKFRNILEADDKYTTKKLIDYLLRQNFFYGDFDGPYKEIDALIDYIGLAQGAALDYERYPQDIFKAHNIMSRNVTALQLTDEEIQAFEEYNQKNASKYEVEVDDFIVLLPHNVEELVKEGNDLNHCVAGYSKRIAAEKTLVGFLRKKDEAKKSLYTIEIKGNKVIQAKGACNEDVPQNIKDLISKVERKWAHAKK